MHSESALLSLISYLNYLKFDYDQLKIYQLVYNLTNMCGVDNYFMIRFLYESLRKCANKQKLTQDLILIFLFMKI